MANEAVKVVERENRACAIWTNSYTSKPSGISKGNNSPTPHITHASARTRLLISKPLNKQLFHRRLDSGSEFHSNMPPSVIQPPTRKRRRAPRRRPPLPDPSTQYHTSRTFQLYPHKAPPLPAGKPKDMVFSETQSEAETEINGRLANCEAHRMQPLTPTPTLKVVLEQPLSTGLRDLRYAQVWKVRGRGQTMVARFYDPLFVYDEANKFDIFKHIDRAVALEANAYDALQELQGGLIPRFVGCFLMMAEKRSVQVVLLEFVSGRDLLHYHPGDDEPVCDNHRVAHGDIAGRNIILKESTVSPTPFCDNASCQLRFRFPTESLLQQMNNPGGPEADYSKVTVQQLNSLPIAIIDFEDIETVDERVADSAQSAAKCGGEPYPKKWFEDVSTPGKQRKGFMRKWCMEDFGWLPSNYDS
ncbi:hypothetical protein C8R47DRAFT_1073369 [Mycena vitilis]|nr:hypothetical protein C8R47DRAFT_1073369 [Mycena vitilis]